MSEGPGLSQIFGLNEYHVACIEPVVTVQLGSGVSFEEEIPVDKVHFNGRGDHNISLRLSEFVQAFILRTNEIPCNLSLI